MAKPKIVLEGTVRDRTDHEHDVLDHVVEGEKEWTDRGRLGFVLGQVEGAGKRMDESIIIAARVKQMDPTGFLETCGARASGLEIVGDTPVKAAVAFLLNHLEPAEAASLASGTDVTDNAIIRCENAARINAVADHEIALVSKVNRWEESHDRSTWKHGDQYLNRAQREAEVTRREGLTKEQRAALAPLEGPSVLKTQTHAVAKAILGSGS